MLSGTDHVIHAGCHEIPEEGNRADDAPLLSSFHPELIFIDGIDQVVDIRFDGVSTLPDDTFETFDGNPGRLDFQQFLDHGVIFPGELQDAFVERYRE